MPKILINEKDFTSPGTPAGYSNFSVLIAGLKGTPSTHKEANIVEPDTNGVYEFSNASAFKDTIGLVSPAQMLDVDNDPNTPSIEYHHYGNQMAYELLNLGYTVIYKVIDKISDIDEASTWEIFKDKASYDFRFITHGLLKSGDVDKASEEARLKIVEEAIKILEDIEKEAQDKAGNPPPNMNFEEAWWKNVLFSGSKDVEDYPADAEPIAGYRDAHLGFKSMGGAGLPYENFDHAKQGTNEEYDSLVADIAKVGVTKGLIYRANKCIADLAVYKAAGVGKDTYNDFDSRELSGRGDCIALIELDENTYAGKLKPEVSIISEISEVSQSINAAATGKFCALTVPSVVYKMTDYDDDSKGNKIFGNNKTFPGAFHYLACFINSLNLGFREWYAAAGYTRGVSSFTVDHTTVKLGEVAINALEPRNNDGADPKFACNVIANFRGSYYLWGNRTAHPLGDVKGGNDLVASHFLNIRQLCTTIKKQLYVACRRFTFDPNSDTLWFNFVNAIKPTLEAMKADQGIRDYKILKVYTDKKATLKAKIRIIPIEAVEDFDLEVSLEDSFGETAAVVTE